MLSAILLGGDLAGHRPAVPGQAERAGQGGAVHREEHRGDAGRRTTSTTVRSKAYPERSPRSRRTDAADRPRRTARGAAWSTRAGARGLPADPAGAGLLLDRRTCSTSTATRSGRHAPKDAGRSACASSTRTAQRDDQNWLNHHTVYTHGNGVIAAFAQPARRQQASRSSAEQNHPAGGNARARSSSRSTSARAHRTTPSSAAPSTTPPVRARHPANRRDRRGQKHTRTPARAASARVDVPRRLSTPLKFREHEHPALDAGERGVAAHLQPRPAHGWRRSPRG